jgi:hypothetical protein
MALGLLRPPAAEDDFDIDAFKARSSPVTLDGIDLQDFVDHPLDPATLRCLRYMHDVEYHTVCYLRDLLVTPAHLDPTVTTFLTLWNVEEMYHGEAIGAVLAAHGELAGRDRIADTRRRLGPFDRVGSTLLSPREVSFLARHLFTGAEGRAMTERIDRRLDQLPGLSGLELTSGAAQRLTAA